MGFDESRRLAVRALPRDTRQLMVKQHFASANQNNTINSTSHHPSATHQHNSINSSGGVNAYYQNALLAISNTVGATRHQPTNEKTLPPEWYIKQMAEYLNRKSPSGGMYRFLTSLRVNITSQPISWVQEFLEQGGMHVYLTLFESHCTRSKKKDLDFVLEYEFLRCYKAIMNNKPGLQEIISLAPRSIEVIVKCSDSGNFFSRRLVPELLTVVCYTQPPIGHQLVMSAFESCRVGKNEMLFQSWIRSFQTVIEKKNKIGGGQSDGMVAGVGWVGDNRITDKDLLEFIVGVTTIDITNNLFRFQI